MQSKTMTVEKAVAALEELLLEETERFQRECLAVWVEDEDDVALLTREQTNERYLAEYGKRAEGEQHPSGYRYELSSEDYESIDSQQGWTEGVQSAIHKLKTIA